jgi:5-methylcytosine-specific restriction enzyme subunit McrC
VREYELIEYLPKKLPKDSLSEIEGERIWREYGRQIDVQFPSPKTKNEWELNSEGWVGHIPVTSELSLSLKPKVALQNLFHMLEYAYRLKSLRFLSGLMSCDSLAAYYQQLAKMLARRVLERGRKGFYRAYVDDTDRLPYVRGRIDVLALSCAPWQAHLWCHYQNHTPDVIENQILNWTLRCISRSGVCTEDAGSEVRRAHRMLQPLVELASFSAAECVDRLYNRLNEDYAALHALCRFFLEHSGPTLSVGTHKFLPFLVEMDRLYELFVYEWLAINLPCRYFLKPQENVYIGPEGDLKFIIDIVIYDRTTGNPAFVADTKYKAPDRPCTSDIAQVATYANLKECLDAVLIYPQPISRPINDMIGNVRVRTLEFDLGGDLEAAGQRFIQKLIS